jgi:hypothetical protein
MIDREPLPRSDNSRAQPQNAAVGRLAGAAQAAGGLLYPANRRMIVVRNRQMGIPATMSCHVQQHVPVQWRPSRSLFEECGHI